MPSHQRPTGPQCLTDPLTNKGTAFTAEERLRLQFRGDFLDVFNHFNLSNPDTSIADRRDGGTPNRLASRRTTASFAWPSVGAARTQTLRDPSGSGSTFS